MTGTPDTSVSACRPPAPALTWGGCWEQIRYGEVTHLPNCAGHHLDAHGLSGRDTPSGVSLFLPGEAPAFFSLSRTKGTPIHDTYDIHDTCFQLFPKYREPENRTVGRGSCPRRDLIWYKSSPWRKPQIGYKGWVMAVALPFCWFPTKWRRGCCTAQRFQNP